MADGPTVSARLTAAQAEARRASEQVRRTSAARLTELLCLAPAERLAHLDETDLIDADRAALRRSLQASLPRGRGPSQQRFRFRFRLRGPRTRRLAARILRLGLNPEIVLPLLLVVAWLGLAWTRTAYVATLTRDVPVRRPGNDGRLVAVVLPKGLSGNVGLGWNGVPRLRHWLPGHGYVTVPLPTDAIAWGQPGRTQAHP
jgi:hypothetical protein